MKFCSSCGSRVPEGGRFCENCGAALTPLTAAPVSEAVMTPAPAVPAAPEAAAPLAGYGQAPPAGGATGPLGSPEPAPPGAPRKSRRGLVAGIGGIAAVGVLGVVGYFVYDQLNGPNGGADSPSAAVLELSAAASGEDAVTALSLLPPGEVGPIVELYQDVEAKATSTGLAAEESPFAGFDVRVDGVAVETEQLGPDVAAVTITSGTVSWALDPEELQGPLRIDGNGEVRPASDGSADLVEITRGASNGAPLRLMTVQRDGKWYVSPMYTLLETWRAEQGLPVPDFSKEIDYAGTGAESATAAVEQAAQRLAAYDVDGFLDLLSPDEAAALYQYRDAIIASLHQDGALAELRSEVQLSVDAVDATAGEKVDDRVPVTVRSASGTFAGGNGSYSWTLDRNCISYSGNGDSDGACLDEVLAREGISSQIVDGLPSLTLLTQEVDGRWYLSPLATVVSQARHVLVEFDTDDVAELLGVPQFGGVDGQLEVGKTLDGSVAEPYGYALYEMEVPAGKVFTPCVDDAGSWSIYGPDGRPAGGEAAFAADGGRYRVIVNAGETTSLSITPMLSDVQSVTVPADVPAGGGGGCGGRLLAFDATADEPLMFETDDGSGVTVTTPSGKTFWGTAFRPTESGQHFLSLREDQTLSIEPLSADVLTVDSNVTGNFDGAQPTTFRVFVDAGQNAEIQVYVGGAVAPNVELYTVDGSLVANSPEAYASYASVYPPSDEFGAQVYILQIQDYVGDSGDFLVTVIGY